MIEYIKGNLADLNPAYAVIEAAGVGYAINIALPTYSALVGKENAETRLYVTESSARIPMTSMAFLPAANVSCFLCL